MRVSHSRSSSSCSEPASVPEPDLCAALSSRAGSDFSATEADGYGHEYAQLSSDANARACGEAHAQALGPALARAYATDGCEAYADTFPAAQLRAVVRVTAERGDPVPVTRLAVGLRTALKPNGAAGRSAGWVA